MPVSSGCTSLVRPLGMILPGATATMSTVPSAAQASREAGHRDDGDGDGAADRRRRRLDDLQRRRQEGELVRASGSEGDG